MEIVNKSKSELRLDEMKKEITSIIIGLEKIERNGYSMDCEMAINADLSKMAECLEDMAKLDGINGTWIANNQEKIEELKSYVYSLGLAMGTFENSFLKGTMSGFSFDYKKVENKVEWVKSIINNINKSLDEKIVKTEQPER